MMSFAFSLANFRVWSGLSSCLNRNFSSSVCYFNQRMGPDISGKLYLSVGWPKGNQIHPGAIWDRVGRIFWAFRHYSLCKDKWDHMAQMHAVAARSTTGVEEKRFSLLISVQYLVKLTGTRVNTLVLLLVYLPLRLTGEKKTCPVSGIHVVCVQLTFWIVQAEQSQSFEYRTGLWVCRSQSLLACHQLRRLLGRPKGWQPVHVVESFRGQLW